MARSKILFTCVALVCVSASSLSAQTLSVPTGYRADPRNSFDPGVAFELQLGGLTYVSSTQELVRYEDGKVQSDDRVLHEVTPAVFGAFLRESPDGESVWFGESSFGEVMRVALDGTGAQLIDQQDFIFDLAFAPESLGELGGRAFVSALGDIDNPFNAIYLFDGDPAVANDEIITNMPIFSGPLIFDDEGNLYYITAGGSFPGEVGERLVRFSASQILSGLGEGAVDFADGEVLARGLTGGYNLVWLDGKLYTTDLGFAGVGGVLEIDPEDEFTVTSFAAALPAHSASNLAVLPGSFRPGDGMEGGRLAVAVSDFSTTSEVAEIFSEYAFVRGEVDGDGQITITDGINSLLSLFQALPLECEDAADVDDAGDRTLTDGVLLFQWLFRGGESPAAPAPAGPRYGAEACGFDPTPDALPVCEGLSLCRE